MFHFTPLLGAQSDSHAHSSLLELDGGIKILVDVGWDEKFDVSMLKEIEKVAPQLSLILLTHPTISHIGAYAHCCKYIPYFTSIPVYSTFPISALGRLLLTDLYLTNPKATPQLPPPSSSTDVNIASTAAGTSFTYDPNWLLPPPTASEIESYFSHVHLLKYSQPHHPLVRTPPTISQLHHTRISGAGHTQQNPTLTITAYAAGHTLGGTIWKIAHSQESIVYAVSWNHTRENHLSGAAFLQHTSGSSSTSASILSSAEGLGRPTALICSSRTTDEDLFGASKWTRRKRDESLLDVIRTVAVGRGKVVLIPTDSVARVLELIYLLEHAFRKDRHLSGSGEGSGAGAALYLVGRKAKALAGVVGSMLEWMDEGVVKELEGTNVTKTQQQQQNQQSKQDGQSRGRNDGRRSGGGGRNQNQQGTQQQPQAVGPFDFLHLKIIEKQAQLEKLLAPFTTLLPSPPESETDQVDDGDMNMDSASETDGGSTIGSMDYDSATGALIEKPRQRKQKNPKPKQRSRQTTIKKKLHQKPPQRPTRGMVIIASDSALEYGFSRAIFTKIAGGEGNVVVLTELMDGAPGSRPGGSLGQELANVWREGMKARRENAASSGTADDIGRIGIDLEWEKEQVELSYRTPLSPPALEAYKKHLSLLRKSSAASHPTAISATTGASLDPTTDPASLFLPTLLPSDVDPDTTDSSSSSSSESDSDHPDKQGKSLATTASKTKKALAAAALKAAASNATGTAPTSATEPKPTVVLPAATVADLGISVLLRGKGVYDFDVRHAKGRNRMMPFAVKRRRGDEYGEVIKAEEYLRAEEREEAAATADGADGKLPGVPGSVSMGMSIGAGVPGLLSSMGDRTNSKLAPERVMGRKRKWEDAGGAASTSSSAAAKSSGTGDGKPSKGKSEKKKFSRKTGKRRKRTPAPTDEEDEEGEVKESDDEYSSSSSTPSDSDSDSSSATNSGLDGGDFQLLQPSKLTTKTVTIPKTRCSIHFIDFTGLHDSRSLRMLLPLINPRKLILVSGTPGQISKLAAECRELLSPVNRQLAAAVVKGRAGGGGSTVDIFTPREGEKVNASVDTNAWMVKLSERLVKGLKWQEVGGLGVVHVVGRVVASEAAVNATQQGEGKKRKMVEGGSDVTGEVVKKEKGDVDQEGDTEMTSSGLGSGALVPPPQQQQHYTGLDEGKTPSRMLDVIQPHSTSPTTTAVTSSTTATTTTTPTSTSTTFHLRNLTTRPIHVGDIKLTDLRRVLTTAGHSAEFAGEGGALVCDGVVVVRKIGVGRVVVEDGSGGLFVGGARGKSFVEVRRRVYEGLAVVRGGVGA